METQGTISVWAEETFGPTSSNFRVAARANEEMAELIRKLSIDGCHPAAPEEIADVVIVLCRLAARMQFRLVFNHHVDATTYMFTHQVLACKINANFARLLEDLALFDLHVGARENACEIASLLDYLCGCLGADLWAEIEHKMIINRSRHWVKDGSGHGYHTRIKEAPDAQSGKKD